MTEFTRPPLSPDVLAHPFWSMSAEETAAILGSSLGGLSRDDVRARVSHFGLNEIEVPQRLRALSIFLNQFASPLILILVVAGGVTFFLQEWVDTSIIFAAVLVNTFLGFWQEYKAETVIELLRSYIRTRVRVKRGGKDEEIDASGLVPGDVIHVSRGDRIPADARIIQANLFQVDESILTGESLPQEKNREPVVAKTTLPERTSMVFSGTLAVEGIAEAIVVSTGSKTEFGKISAFIRSRERAGNHTPLEAALSRFSFWVGVILFHLVVILFSIGLSYGHDPFEMFLISVAVAVSAVPEGLPIALTVILAVAVERLSKRNAVIRKLLAAETLGSTSLILTDKTGTLTEARMKVEDLFIWGSEATDEARKKMLSYALSHATAIVENPLESWEKWHIIGNPLEMAVIRSAASHGISYDPEALGVVERLPFDPRRKFAAVCREEGKENRLILLGAPDALIPFSELTESEEKEARSTFEEKARAGGRVLSVATKRVTGDVGTEFETLRAYTFGAPTPDEKKRDFTLEGFIVLRDPLRPGVKDAIQRIQNAGVRTVIVTGDHQGTAEAVARELGMIGGEGALLTGEDLKSLTKEELIARSKEISVYARVTPEQKVMLVNLYKEQGEVVAVTGDGVNDAPALETADIGVAVGSGTDVTKSVADLVILDDNYETIVEAISEGRHILDNIRKVIVYLLSGSLDELLLIGCSIVVGVAMPLNALQILFVNFFSDSFPAIALAFEKGIDSIGSRPRTLKRNIFDSEMRFLILVIGISTSFLLFVLYYVLLSYAIDPALVRTFIFTSFATYSLILAFSLRSLKKSIFEYNPFSNHYLNGGVAIGLLLTFAVIYIPFLRTTFETVSLPLPWLLGVFAVGFVNICAVELGKLLFRKRNL